MTHCLLKITSLLGLTQLSPICTYRWRKDPAPSSLFNFSGSFTFFLSSVLKHCRAGAMTLVNFVAVEVRNHHHHHHHPPS